MTQVRVDGHWYEDPSIRGFVYIAPGLYEEGVVPEPTLTLPMRAAQELVPLLEQAGLIKPRLDERLRVEDLKITHRLIDLLEKKPRNA